MSEITVFGEHIQAIANFSYNINPTDMDKWVDSLCISLYCGRPKWSCSWSVYGTANLRLIGKSQTGSLALYNGLRFVGALAYENLNPALVADGNYR